MRNERNTPTYEEKFRSLIELCRQAKENNIDVVMIHHPEVLGDNYEELVESLNRISGVGLRLVILPPDQRGEPDIPKTE